MASGVPPRESAAMIRFKVINFGRLREAYRQRGGDPYADRFIGGPRVGGIYRPRRRPVLIQGGKP